MDSIKYLAACLLAACASSPARNEPRMVAEAELAFARDAQVRTVNDAFMAAFAPDGIVFRPTPQNAQQVFRSQPYPANTLLMWGPTSAETAAAGDLAVTTGPAQWGQRGQPPVGTGYFLSVWRNRDGKWQVVIDAGIEAPIPAPVGEATRSLATRTLRPATAQRELMQVEHALVEDYADDFRDYAASDVRVYRNGHAPTLGVGSALTLIEADDDTEWSPQAAHVSKTGDLGYTYGIARDDGKEVGYLRVWRNQEGSWKLAYDLR